MPSGAAFITAFGSKWLRTMSVSRWEIEEWEGGVKSQRESQVITCSNHGVVYSFRRRKRSMVRKRSSIYHPFLVM